MYIIFHCKIESHEIWNNEMWKETQTLISLAGRSRWHFCNFFSEWMQGKGLSPLINAIIRLLSHFLFPSNSSHLHIINIFFRVRELYESPLTASIFRPYFSLSFPLTTFSRVMKVFPHRLHICVVIPRSSPCNDIAFFGWQDEVREKRSYKLIIQRRKTRAKESKVEALAENIGPVCFPTSNILAPFSYCYSFFFFFFSLSTSI